jgi:hypothetical protein
MDELLLSQKQYQALIERLDEIRKEVNSIRLKSDSNGNLLDSYDLKQLFHVSESTLKRWRKSGNLPYFKIERKYYYEVDAILACFKVYPNSVSEHYHPSSGSVESIDKEDEITCKRCPLFVIFNM